VGDSPLRSATEIKSRREREGELTRYQIEQNEFQKKLWQESAKAIAKYLEERGSLKHPIYYLTFAELQGMAVAAICEFVRLREEKRKELNLKDSETLSWETQPIDNFIGELKQDS
jgi:hypothetical protein